jgi:hypothetical protein
MLRIIQEKTLEMDKKWCACLIDCQKAFDNVKWIKLMQTLNKSGTKRRERRLISKLCMDQSVKV